MKALVTGATGFLGSALVARLLEGGARDVRAFVRSEDKRGRLAQLAGAFPGAAVDAHKGTLATQAGAAAAIEGVNVVYHLAAAMGGAPADIFLNTVVASKNLLEAVAGAPRPPKVVLVSSFGVYGFAALPRNAIVDETTPLEPHPERRDPYSHAKLRQERLFRDYQRRVGFPLVVLRPGAIYGPSGPALSTRVGLNLAGVFLSLGGGNALPLSFVDNCADAIALAAERPEAIGRTYNVHDDDLPTCDAYLDAYQKQVGKLRAVRVPYAVLFGISALVERYHAWSKGQLPAVFTRYKTATTWKGNRFDNARLKGLGWRQRVPTDEGMKRTFASLRARAPR